MAKNIRFLAGQIFQSFILRAIGIIITLLQVPLMIDLLKTEKYGVWLTLFNILNWISIFDLGITNGLRNKLSELYVNNDDIKMGKYIMNVMYFLFFVFSFLFLIFLFLLPRLNLNQIFNTNSISYNEFYYLLLISVSGIIFKFILQVPVTLESAKGLINVTLFIQTLGSVLGLIILYLLTYFKIEINLIIMSLLIIWLPNLVFIFYNLYFFLFRYKKLKFDYFNFDFEFIRPILNISFYFFVSQITSLISFASIPFMITKFCGPVATANYNVTFSLYNLPILLMSIFCGPLTPLTSQAVTKKDNVWLRNHLRHYIVLILGLVAFSLVLTFYSHQIYFLWLKNRIVLNDQLIWILFIYSSVNVIVQPFSNMLNGIGDLKGLAILGPASVLVFFLLLHVNSASILTSADIIFWLVISSIGGLFYVPYKVINFIRKLN